MVEESVVPFIEKFFGSIMQLFEISWKRTEWAWSKIASGAGKELSLELEGGTSEWEAVAKQNWKKQGVMYRKGMSSLLKFGNNHVGKRACTRAKGMRSLAKAVSQKRKQSVKSGDGGASRRNSKRVSA